MQRSKKEKDAPKKGRTAFVLFLMEYRAALKANSAQGSNSAADFSQVSKQVSEAWKQMNLAARQPYVQRSKAEMAECEPSPAT